MFGLLLAPRCSALIQYLVRSGLVAYLPDSDLAATVI